MPTGAMAGGLGSSIARAQAIGEPGHPKTKKRF
jgi:hypothetical protein